MSGRCDLCDFLVRHDQEDLLAVQVCDWQRIFNELRAARQHSLLLLCNFIISFIIRILVDDQSQRHKVGAVAIEPINRAPFQE